MPEAFLLQRVPLRPGRQGRRNQRGTWFLADFVWLWFFLILAAYIYTVVLRVTLVFLMTLDLLNTLTFLETFVLVLSVGPWVTTALGLTFALSVSLQLEALSARVYYVLHLAPGCSCPSTRFDTVRLTHLFILTLVCLTRRCDRTGGHAL